MAGQFGAKIPFMAGGKSYSLWFRHKDLKDVVNRTNKSITDLLGDPMAGWPELLQVGLRWQHPRLTVDDCCEVIDGILSDGQDFKVVGDKLLDALTACGYLKTEKVEAPEDAGNAQSPNTSAA